MSKKFQLGHVLDMLDEKFKDLSQDHISNFYLD